MLTGMATGFSVALNDSDTAKNVAKGKVADKDAFRKVSETAARSVAKVINANGNISNGLKAELGINVTPAPIGPVHAPSALEASGSSTGRIDLKWKRNGNGAGTMFMVESCVGDSTTWSLVGATTKTKFFQTNLAPGVKVVYRVFAQRDDVKSDFSNEATVYGIAEPPVFQLKAA